MKSVIGPRPWKRRVLPFPWNYWGLDFSESGNLALSEQRARRRTTPATSTKSGSANASRKQRVGTCCFGFMTEGEPTEEKTEFERENRRQDLSGGERGELWLDEARNRTNDRDMKRQDEDR